MNVACDYEAPMQMLTTEKYIACWPCLLRHAGVIAHHHTPKLLLKSVIFNITYLNLVNLHTIRSKMFTYSTP